MEFKDFAQKLKNVIGGASNTWEFTKTLFETMMNDSGPELLANLNPNTFKSYYNGNTGISRVAALVLANLCDDNEFSEYLDGFGETTAQLLADEFADDIPGINSANASEKIAELFFAILREASGKKKNTPKSADNEIVDLDMPEEAESNPGSKSPSEMSDHDVLTESMLRTGRVMAEAFGRFEHEQAERIRQNWEQQPSTTQSQASKNNEAEVEDSQCEPSGAAMEGKKMTIIQQQTNVVQNGDHNVNVTNNGTMNFNFGGGAAK